ncbi:hypothetical protein MAR_008302 [Mya arenaria]|uniref:Uncharacterized protein n=1 Tax=Mya arenaria TaxID=6604 RepID=A0ABY7E005_MYAAR|nr:hypothetical protein MAR_008302 [Mya arenaria]
MMIHCKYVRQIFATPPHKDPPPTQPVPNSCRQYNDPLPITSLDKLMIESEFRKCSKGRIIIIHCLKSPVVSSLESPVVSSLESPVVSSLESPVVSSIESSVVSSLESPVVSSLESPVVSSLESPVVSSLESPVVSSLESPVVSSLESPVVSSLESPVVSSLESPVVSSLESPVVSSLESPVMRYMYSNVSGKANHSEFNSLFGQPSTLLADENWEHIMAILVNFIYLLLLVPASSLESKEPICPDENTRFVKHIIEYGGYCEKCPKCDGGGFYKDITSTCKLFSSNT